MKFWEDGFGMFVCRCGANWGGLREVAHWQEVFLPFDTLHFQGEFVEFFVELGKHICFKIYCVSCHVTFPNVTNLSFILTKNYI